MNWRGKVFQWLIDRVMEKIFRVRSGHYSISLTAQDIMEKIGIHEADIEDAFRYGVEERPATTTRPGKIKRVCGSYTVGINHLKKEDGSYFITNCWKYKETTKPYWMKPKVYK